MFTVEPCVAMNLAQLTMNFDRRYVLAFKNFIADPTSQSAGAGIRTSIFDPYNDATARTREISLEHVSCGLVIL